VFITAPAEGATVSGTVWSDVWVENYVGTSNTFTLSIGDTVLATGTASSHATLAWTAARSRRTADADGDRARFGRARRHGTRALTIKNGTTPPLTAAFTSPAAGATVSGTVTVA